MSLTMWAPASRLARATSGLQVSTEMMAVGRRRLSSAITGTTRRRSSSAVIGSEPGRVDSPPTFYKGTIIFGSCDGYVYCLRASDGVMAWRFQAAPRDERLMVYQQLESVWPVHGSVLIRNDVAYFVAGRSMFLAGGLVLYRLNPTTGEMLSKVLMDDEDPNTGENLHEYVAGVNNQLSMPTASRR